MEEYLLNFGMSHTWSKVWPYLLVLIFGILLSRLVYRRFKSRKPLAMGLALFFLLAPFVAYFAVNPIYQGDFGVNGQKQSFRNVKTTLFKEGLLVVAIPGCPYCMESIAGLKQMKLRNPNLKIEFAVCGSDDEAVLQGYKSEVEGKFKVTLLKNEAAFTDHTGNSFPTFVMIKKGKAVYSWTNNEFGVRARDWVENV